MSRRRWPKEVPILTGDDIVRRKMSSCDGERHCLLGWKCTVFDLASHGHDATMRKAQDALDSAAGTCFIAQFNDSTRNSKDEIAAVWNRAMAKLGYVVGNPEA